MEKIQGEMINFLKEMGISHAINHPMNKSTSFKVGGPADIFCKTSKKEEIIAIVTKTKELGLPLTLMGRGSNLIVRDKGIRGVVLSVTGDCNEIYPIGEDPHRFYASAGVPLSAIANYALAHGLTGLEFAHGIPGNLGGGIYMNAGAYGGELRDVITKIHHLDSHMVEGCYTPYEAFMSYRYSDYSVNNYLITGAEFYLEKGEEDKIKERMDYLKEQRSSKQPLEYPSAGSTFKRPKGAFAAALIEECGLKGLSVGGAEVSEKHSGFVINKGGATCSDVLTLCQQVCQIIKTQKGFDLELEPLVIGEE